ncbi:MAG: hypothetical protein ACOC6K_01980, partial [Thermodesulfobacteriota bacterium]
TLELETSAKIMQNSRPRLYFAGEGACSTRYWLLREALAKVIFVIQSEAKDLDSSVACGSLRMTDM